MGVAIFKQLLAAGICSFALFVVGTTVGWPSPIISKIKETGKPLNLTSSEISWMVSLMYLGTIASPIPAGMVMDCMGRRNSLLLFVMFPLSSWLLVLFTARAYELYIARFLAGVWNGVAATIAPVYIAEISQAKVRGALSTLMTISAHGGLLLVYVLGTYLEYQILILTMISLPVVFFLGFIFMPESPIYYIMKDKKEKAVKSLTWLRGEDYAMLEVEYFYMERSVYEEMKTGSYKELFTQKGNRKGLVIVLVLAVSQRMSGISVLNAYASSALGPEGVGELTPNECVIVIGSALVVSVIVATFLIDNVGRTPLLLSSAVVCGLAMFAVGLNFFLYKKINMNYSGFHAITFANFLVYSVGFCIGLGPVPITIQGEIFPSNVKGLASGITIVILSAASLLTNKIYHPIERDVGAFLSYWIFSLFCLLTTLFVAFYFIETKGKTLREIQELLDHKRVRITRHHE